MITIFKRATLLIVFAVSAALLVNHFSPVGIALIGQWDLDKGIVSANNKDFVHYGLVEIDNIEIAKLIHDDGKAQFIDARANDAFIEGHIKGAISLPVGKFDIMIEHFLNRYLPEQPIVTYCSGRTCEDSHRLAQLLIEFGYEKVSIMIDGFPGWRENGYPVE